ncbi:MAG: T9SS type A sorting domain-containing protein [Ignavibacteriae bacterium]|nr:T9SS type A sorting domain-containing protein [Ignavibacteriota bacterium]
MKIQFSILLSLLLWASQWTFGQSFSPVWRTAPWDSGGVSPSSLVWSMVRSELDLDNDGKKEFLAVSSWSNSYYNTVYLFEAAGNNRYDSIWSYSFYPYSNDYSAVTVADLDGDGRKEILCLIDPSDSTYHGFYVFEWNGTNNGFPSLPTTTWTMSLRGAFDEGGAIIAGDFDNDGRDEVAVSLQERYSIPKSRIMIFSLAAGSSFSNPTWNIEMNDSTTFLYAGYALESTDLDRDGRKEIVTAGWERHTFVVYENTGSANSYVLAAYITGIDTAVDLSNMGFAEANFDNNGTNELYIATADGRFYVMTNPGDVSQITAANVTKLQQYNPYKGIAGVSKGDVDGDGKPELYLAGSYHEAVFQWKYSSGPVTNPASYVRTTIFQDDTTDQHTSGSDQGWLRPSKVAVGDFDSDGRPDMVIASASLARDKSVLTVVEQIPNDVVESGTEPEEIALFQNYPNPFNPTTTIGFKVPASSAALVSMKIFDQLGSEVATLVNKRLEPGDHTVVWNASTRSSGVYYCRLTVGTRTYLRKMILER